MEISRAGLEALKSHEGLRLKAYPDHSGDANEMVP